MAERVAFKNSQGQELAGLLDIPDGRANACALFAHCFTCSKEINAAANISQTLASAGIETLRFDFTGLGESEGEFRSTNFTTNIDDLVTASEFLTRRNPYPLLLIGHSLGGTAVLAARSQIPQARAIVTLASPYDPEHVTHLLGGAVTQIQSQGETNVRIAGRTFRISRQFLEDIASHEMETHIADLNRPLLVLHSPTDEIVEVENAILIFDKARYSKSFISLDGMDHLIQSRDDRQYIGRLIASWADRYLTRL